MSRTPLFLLVVCVLLGAAPLAHAQDDDGWHGRVELPLWIYGSHGNAVVGGQEVDVDTTVGDAIDNFSKLIGAFSGVGEVGKGNWRAFLGGTFMEVRSDSDLGPLRLRTTTEIDMWDVGLGYRLRGDARGDDGYLDLIGGMRSFDIDITLRNRDTGAEAVAGKERSVGFFGVKGGHALSERWQLEYRADAGGFSSNNMTWQAYLGARRMFSKRGYVSMGYRLLDIDYTSGGGSGYTYDALQHGPSFAVGWKF